MLGGCGLCFACLICEPCFHIQYLLRVCLPQQKDPAAKLSRLTSEQMSCLTHCLCHKSHLQRHRHNSNLLHPWPLAKVGQEFHRPFEQKNLTVAHLLKSCRARRKSALFLITWPRQTLDICPRKDVSRPNLNSMTHWWQLAWAVSTMVAQNVRLFGRTSQCESCYSLPQLMHLWPPQSSRTPLVGQKNKYCSMDQYGCPVFEPPSPNLPGLVWASHLGSGMWVRPRHVKRRPRESGATSGN